MIGSKELFEQEQERHFHENESESHYDELPGIGPLPILDLNTLTPDEAVVKLDKDTLNLKSSDIALQIINAINEGQIDPLEFAVKKKLVVDALEMAMKDPSVRRLALEQVESYGKQGCSKLGAKITTTSRATYQYDKDQKWSAIKAEMKPLEEKLKAQEEKIKAACKNNASLVSDEGEIIASIVPAPTTESISISFAKR